MNILWIVDIIACVFTVGALVFTLYLWLLDHLIEEELEFTKSKTGVLETLHRSYDVIKDKDCISKNGKNGCIALLHAIKDVTEQMEIILGYRFWARSGQKAAYTIVNDFYRDSRYAISTITRYIEGVDPSIKDKESLVSIDALNQDEIEDIRSDYEIGLSFTIEFLENWR